MRIGYEISALQANQSGTAIYTYNLFSTMRKFDNRNTYIPLNNKFRFSKKNLVTKVSNALIEVLYFQAISPIQAACSNVDIIHYPANISPVISKYPTIVTIYDLMFHRFPDTYDLLYLYYAKVFFYLSARRANRIITISEFSKQDIIRYCNVHETKVRVIYPGVDPGLLPVEKKQAQAFVEQYYGLGESQFILFTGEITPRKNLINLIIAFAQLRKMKSMTKIKLVLVGEKRNPKYLQSLENLIENLGVKSAVYFLGYVPREHLKYLLSASCLVAYISLCEGFGLPIVEAMACGTPVITSNVSSIPEVAGEAAILVNPEKIDEITDGIYKLLDDSNLYKYMSELGLHHSKSYCWENTARETLQLYDDVYAQK